MIENYYRNKVVLVTGATSGIGKELARQLLTKGAHVVVCGRDTSRIAAMQAEFTQFEEKLLCIKADVTDAQTLQHLRSEIIRKFGRLDLLITNAALTGMAKIEEASPLMMKDVVGANIFGTLFPIMTFLPDLRKSRGKILMISSLAGLHGLPDYASYSLSKMALRSLQQSLRIELKNSGIRVCLAYVGFTKNESTKTMFDLAGNPVPMPSRPALLQSSRATTASRLLFQLRNGIPVMSTAPWGEIYRFLALHFPSLISILMIVLYKEKSNQVKNSGQ